MNMIELLTRLTLACIPTFLVVDLVHRARRFETPRFWRLRAFAVTVGVFGLSMAIAIGWAGLIGENTLFNLAGLGTGVGAVTGILVYELVHYSYHRFAHKSDFVWKWFHQMHHSAESLDAFGANYLSPLDTLMFTSIASLVFFPLLGLSPAAGAIATLFITFNAMFQHANLKTPRWLGYVIQRPESHGVHHERGVHRYNYSDLPLWDMVFGTFRNPESFDRQVGFYNGASARVGEMLVGRDVSEAPATTAVANGSRNIAKAA